MVKDWTNVGRVPRRDLLLLVRTGPMIVGTKDRSMDRTGLVLEEDQDDHNGKGLDQC